MGNQAGQLFGAGRLRDIYSPPPMQTPAPPALNPVANPISTIVKGGAPSENMPPPPTTQLPNPGLTANPNPIGAVPRPGMVNPGGWSPNPSAPPTGIIGSLVKGIGGMKPPGGQEMLTNPLQRTPEKPNLQRSQRLNPEVVNRPNYSF